MHTITIENRLFDLIKTVECGQYFHWYQSYNQYTLVHQGQVLYGSQNETHTTLQMEDPAHWESFLRIGSHEGEVQPSVYPELKEILEYSQGLTLLGQDPFLTIMSFILSANNHFKRIQGAIQEMAKRYGTPITSDVYAFPSPEQMAHVTTQMYRDDIHVGYRDKYLQKTVAMINAGEFDLDAPFALPTDEARKYVMQLPGVGPKVADCILLFAYQKPDVFPVDVWMHRAMQVLYWDREATRKEVFDDAIQRFGDQAGYIQQLIFYYGKMHKIGVS